MVFLILSSIISGCSIQKNVQGTTIEQIQMPQIFFCPQDDCELVFAQAISQAQRSVQCAFFEFNSKKIIDILKEKSAHIPIQIVIDERSFKDQLPHEIVKVANPVQYMHNKFCVIDDIRVVSGSANPTDNDLTLNNNNILIIDSAQLARNYKAEFNELWNGVYGKGQKNAISQIKGSIDIENYFCPEDECQKQVIDSLMDQKTGAEVDIVSIRSAEIDHLLKIKASQRESTFYAKQSPLPTNQLIEFTVF